MNIARGHRSLISGDAFLESILHFREDPTNNAALLANAFNRSLRIKSIVHQACTSKNLSFDYQLDIRQELYLLFERKYAGIVTPLENAYSVLSVSANHLATHVLEKRKEHSLQELTDDHPEDLLLTPTALDDAKAFDPYISVAQQIDLARAETEFQRRIALMQGARKPQLPDPEKIKIPTILNLSSVFANSSPEELVVRAADFQKERSGPRVKRGAQPRARSVTEAGSRLKDIRQHLRVVMPDFAVLLNISSSTLTSYIYGTVQTVPQEVMDRAEALMLQAPSAYFSMVDPSFRLDESTMESIVQMWAKGLGLEFAQDSDGDSVGHELASIIGVSRPTVWRWKKKNMVPPMKTLRLYDESVFKAINLKKQTK